MVTALSDYAGGSDHEGVRTLGNLSLNLNSYRVAVGQDVIGLTYHELELLRVFFDKYDRVNATGTDHRPRQEARGCPDVD